MSFVLGVALAMVTATPNSSTLLWYRQPAADWVEALPVGNGRLGAMVFGRTQDELIQLNESTVWTGGPYSPYGDGKGAESLPEIQQLVFQGKGREAEALFEKEWMSKTGEQAQYQPLGDLRLSFAGHALPKDYRRELDLDRAVATTDYSIGSTRFHREVFATAVDGVIVVRISADKPGQVSFSSTFNGRTNTKEQTDAWYLVESQKPGTVVLRGQTASYGGGGGLRYEAQMIARPEGGSVQLDFTREHDSLRVQGANAVTLFIAASTNFKSYKELGGDPGKTCQEVLAKAVKKPYEELLADHVADHQRLFRRVSIDLGKGRGSDLPTDERFDAFARGDDPALPALYFQFGRYLLASCSRPGGTPPNLQGLWNADMNPAWGSKFTTNINFEMNFWPADAANLSDCEDPLWSAMDDLSVTGAQTATKLWGARGWTLLHNMDQWRATAPIHGAYWAAWHGGAAWLCTMAWEHYTVTADESFLRRAYPWMKGVAEFFHDTLVTDPSTGLLVTNPSSSPENGPGGDKAWKFNPDGSFEKPVGICAAPAIDMWMLREFFDDFMLASKTLGLDAELRSQVEADRSKLAPVRIGQYGQIQEWQQDLDLPDDHHRHVSQLWGLFPGTQVSPTATPDYAHACRVSLEERGDEGSGWSMAWKTALWARLGDGDHAFKLLSMGLRRTDNRNMASRGGGTYPNLFCSHPPFQIDGNLGNVRAMCEMLVQSQGGVIRPLAALPSAWKAGSVTGLRCVGGFLVGLSWSQGKLRSLQVTSQTGGPCRIANGKGFRIVGKDPQTLLSEQGMVTLLTTKGATYDLVPVP